MTTPAEATPSLRSIRLRVNGREHTFRVDPATPLIYILRNDLGLKAAKLACGLEQCGACKVLIDGQARPSCKIPVGELQGREIVTLEGLAADGSLHPVQQAFVDEQATQCGYCAPGMIMAAIALLKQNPQPSDDDIGRGLARHLLPLQGLPGIIRAIRRAAQLSPASRPGGAAVIPESLSSSLRLTPDLDRWIRIDPGGTVTVFTGKVEIGQGIQTVIVQIAAEELDVSMQRMQVILADTLLSPDEGFTAGSMSTQVSGGRAPGRSRSRHILVRPSCRATRRSPMDRLRAEDGTVYDPETGYKVTYWELMAGKRFNQQVSGRGRPSPPQNMPSSANRCCGSTFPPR